MKIAILTDTNSGICEEEAEKMGIFVMPMPVIIEDETFYEGSNLTEEEFLEALTSGKKVSTSQPAPGDLLDTWDDLLKKYDQVVYIPMSSGLSHSCSAAMAIASDLLRVLRSFFIAYPPRKEFCIGIILHSNLRTYNYYMIHISSICQQNDTPAFSVRIPFYPSYFKHFHAFQPIYTKIHCVHL